MITAPELSSICENLRPTIINYLVSKLKISYPAAEDIFQEGIIKFWRAYKRPRKPLNLMVEICKNLTYDQTKRKFPAKYENPTQDDNFAVDTIGAKYMVKNIHGKEYTFLKLLIDGYCFKDISMQMGIPVRRMYTIINSIKNKIV